MPDPLWTLPAYPTGVDVDIVTDLEFLREYATSHYPGVPYKRCLTRPEELDDVHHEIAFRNRTYAAPVLLYGFVTQAGTSEQPTTKGVIDWERPITLHVPTPILEDLGLVTLDGNSDMSEPLVGMGDVFRFHEYDFEVLQANRSKERYHNTDIPMYWIMQARRLRPDSAQVITWDMDPS